MKKINKLIYKLAPIIQKFVKQDTVILADYYDEAELIECYTMFQWLQANNIKSYYLVEKTLSQANEIKAKYGKNVILYDSNKFELKVLCKLIKTRYFLSSFGIKNDKMRKFLKNNKKIDFIFTQHGIVFTTNRCFITHNSNVYDKVIVSNEDEAKRWVEFGGFKKENIILGGLFRWDNLNNLPKQKEKSIFLFPTWRMTFREKDFDKSKYYKSIVSLLDRLKDYNVKIYYGMHHDLHNIGKKQFTINNKNVEIVPMNKISDYIKKCDLLITDYSSINFDFLFQNKPVIYYLVDYKDDYLVDLDTQAVEAAYINLDKLFNKCTTEQEVIDLIEFYIKNDFKLESEKKAILNNFFYCKKDICKTIYKQLRSK